MSFRPSLRFTLPIAAVALAVLASAAGSVSAQQLYRWVDEKGKVHVTDRPPPPSAAAKVEKKSYSTGTSSAPVPFELARAQKEFPVTLYTAPSCEVPCRNARDALNKRGVPFKEVQVYDEASHAELKKVSGESQVPVMLVGTSVHKGFEAGAYDAALDLAGYPKQGVLAARNQGVPKPPGGYPGSTPESTPKPVGEAKKGDSQALGPYAPRFSSPPKPEPKQ